MSRPILMPATEKGTYISLDFSNHNLIVAKLKSSSYKFYNGLSVAGMRLERGNNRVS